jgi:bifunctional DNA-binding transcriptional regulator/antitoxin component of YhaV-PrlF toxin-antitoxin module
MTFVATIDERGQLAIPGEVMEGLRLEPGATVEVEVRAPDQDKARSSDADRFNRWFEKYRGSKRAEFLAAGYTSIEEYMNDLRGR